MTDHLLLEIENMAINAAHTFSISSTEVNSADTERWQFLFGLSPSQAQEQITRYRTHLSRGRISDDSWEKVKVEKEAAGFDRESYEFSLQNTNPGKMPMDCKGSLSATTYKLKLEGPFGSTERVREIERLREVPELVQGPTEKSDEMFCKIDNTTRHEILNWLTQFCPTFRPTITELE